MECFLSIILAYLGLWLHRKVQVRRLRKRIMGQGRFLE